MNDKASCIKYLTETREILINNDPNGKVTNGEIDIITACINLLNFLNLK